MSRDGDHGAVGGDQTEDGDWEFSSWGPNDWDPTPEDAITPRRVPRAWRIVGIVAVLSVLFFDEPLYLKLLLGIGFVTISVFLFNHKPEMGRHSR